ncbi:Zn(II)2Cys6 transcription factor domain-containing protein [Aspergillus affinis]|uniref:Zn(II)2Cys6 transcription factor domain-containing protein n=1 Tax=Aspergillus affinis TaxID=1070780 RepID=UPI0022FEB71F|nr:uncharacterized protein KD926_001334 [Aspergillus affinis]KAI9036756.1 hypothetical protein KD926_001334 [Aspergillus affinis]
MPGVPTSRGCEACRKQKKRCDQEQPACGRCLRLGIPCVGGGARRFKFTENRTPDDVSGIWVAQAAPPPRDAPPQRAIVRRAATAIHGAPARALCSETVRLRASLISMLEVKDARYNLGYYGPFFALLPCRLGVHPALDAAVAAVTHSAPCLFKQESSSLALEKYGRALYMLRLSLHDGAVDLAIETLCTIYLLWISEVGWDPSTYFDWITGNSEGHLMHTHVIALLLKSVARRTDIDTFQTHLLRTLCMAVLVHSVFDPRVHLDTLVINRFLVHGPRFPPSNQLASPFDTLTVPNFARIPRLIHHPEDHLTQLTSLYAQMQSDFPKLRAIAVSPTLQASPTASLETIRSQINYQTAYGLFLSVATMLNRLCFVADSSRRHLQGELDVLCDEIVALGRRGLVLRPLGSHYMPMSLSAAWAAVGFEEEGNEKEVEGRKKEIEALAREYCSSDGLMQAWRARGMQTRWQFERFRRKMDGGHEVVLVSRGGRGLVAVD